MAQQFFRKTLTMQLEEPLERKRRALERAKERVFSVLPGLLGYSVWVKDDALLVEGPDARTVGALISTAKDVCGGMPSRTAEVTAKVDADSFF